jgi:hypothetical protein
MPPAAGPVQTSANAVTDWTIGPVIRGRNYSQGMPLHPTMGRSGPYFDFPYPSADAGHVHYITQNIGPIPNARAISLRYRIDAYCRSIFSGAVTTGSPKATINFIAGIRPRPA